jgi:hypothetical protein
MGTMAEYKFLEKFLRTLGPTHRVHLACTNKRDGLGAQAIRVMSVIAYCRARGITYVHRPFDRVWGAPPDDPHYTPRCEDFLRLGEGEIRLSDMGLPSQSAADACEAPVVFDGKNVLIGIVSTVPFISREPTKFLAGLPLFRERFGFDERLRAPRDTPPGAVRIAAHIRRGDVSLARYAGRYTENDVYVTAFRRIRDLIAPLGVTLHFEVYSQGKEEEFAEFAEFNAELRIDTPLFEDVESMATADVLLIAKSALSYVAAIYSTGVKLFQPFWVEPLPGWLPYGPEVEFDGDAFLRVFEANAAERAIRSLLRMPAEASRPTAPAELALSA